MHVFQGKPGARLCGAQLYTAAAFCAVGNNTASTLIVSASTSTTVVSVTLNVYDAATAANAIKHHFINADRMYLTTSHMSLSDMVAL